jgi:5-methylcytosine-specific restriction endonuclease McrA
MIKIVSRKCVVCGSRFDVNYRLGNKTCSKRCSLENERIVRKKNGANRRHDKRISRDKRIDNITLKKLYRRDEGKCYLCGGVCNWNDWRVSDNGNKYPGDTYPTIEHVVPISKGGFDSWDNVRLACWKCNLEKSDSILKVKPMDKAFAYSEKRLGTQPKKTAQYTLDGKLIKIWDSTADIRRTLGLNDKHIQNICRGNKSKTGNAYGYHWEYIEKNNDKCG